MPLGDVDVERLSAHLRALAHPARLELLRLLRRPAAPAEMEVRPRRRDADLHPERAMSRQSIMDHLATLEEVGVVNRIEADGATRYVTSAQRLFALVEELRSLTALEPSMRVDVEATLANGAADAPAWTPGPRLVLLGGPWEGRAFALAGAGPWTLGRSRERDVALTYDPFASAEQARIERQGATLTVRPEEGARNPTRLNFATLATGAPRPLRPGDVIGIGRSHLVFQP